MTLYGLTASLAWAALAAFFIVRAESVARHWIARMWPEATPDPSAIEIPEDLLALASAETEKWAVDQTLESIRERYQTYGNDWNRVRAAFGLGGMT